MFKEGDMVKFKTSCSMAKCSLASANKVNECYVNIKPNTVYKCFGRLNTKDKKKRWNTYCNYLFDGAAMDLSKVNYYLVDNSKPWTRKNDKENTVLAVPEEYLELYIESKPVVKEPKTKPMKKEDFLSAINDFKI